jgi:hypothetical protein
LAFPLHPPGRPERSRLAELTSAGVPVLVVQGQSDPFGRPEEFPEQCDVRPVPGDHGFAAPKGSGWTRAGIGEAVVGIVAAWLDLVAPPVTQ